MNGVTIQRFRAYCKAVLDDTIANFGLLGLIFIVGGGSFGLGRLSALESVREPISVGKVAEAANTMALAPGGFVVASKSGSVYYLPWCAGAQKIETGKAVWFSSEQAARDAGYSPSKSCKGLQQ